jgi:hypothetical protein
VPAPDGLELQVPAAPVAEGPSARAAPRRSSRSTAIAIRLHMISDATSLRSLLRDSGEGSSSTSQGSSEDQDSDTTYC